MRCIGMNNTLIALIFGMEDAYFSHILLDIDSVHVLVLFDEDMEKKNQADRSSDVDRQGRGRLFRSTWRRWKPGY